MVLIVVFLSFRCSFVVILEGNFLVLTLIRKFLITRMIHPSQPGILTELIEFNQFLAKSLPNMVSDIGLGAERAKENTTRPR